MATPAAITVAMGQITQPFSSTVLFVSSRPRFDWMPVALLAVWAFGLGSVALIRIRGWRRIRAVVPRQRSGRDSGGG